MTYNSTPPPASRPPRPGSKPKAKAKVFAAENMAAGAPDQDGLEALEESMRVIASTVSPDWIIGSGTDNKGHSARVWGTVTPTTKALMNVLISSGVCPAFKSENDVLRAGIWFVLRMLNYWKLGQSDQVASLAVQHCIIEDMIREEQSRISFEKTFQDLRVVVNHHMGQGHYAHAKSTVERIRAQVLLMPEGHWKTQYMKKMEEFNILFGTTTKEGGMV